MFVIIGVIIFLNNSSCINILIAVCRLYHREGWGVGVGQIFFFLLLSKASPFRFNQGSEHVTAFYQQSWGKYSSVFT